jgi:uncharacterized protein DUF1292
MPGAGEEEILLVDENGVDRRFLLHDAFDADGQVYYLVEAVDDPDEVILLKEASGTLESVDEAEFDRVLALLEAEE